LSVSESQRLALHRAAKAALGEEEGDTLMELSPPSNTDIATRQDVERAEERLGARIDAVDARFTTVNARFDATRKDVERAEERLGARIDAVDARFTTVNARFDAVDARIDAAVAASAAMLRKSIHASELRTMAVIVAAFLGSNLLG